MPAKSRSSCRSPLVVETCRDCGSQAPPKQSVCNYARAWPDRGVSTRATRRSRHEISPRNGVESRQTSFEPSQLPQDLCAHQEQVFAPILQQIEQMLHVLPLEFGQRKRRHRLLAPSVVEDPPSARPQAAFDIRRELSLSQEQGVIRRAGSLGCRGPRPPLLRIPRCAPLDQLRIIRSKHGRASGASQQLQPLDTASGRTPAVGPNNWPGFAARRISTLAQWMSASGTPPDRYRSSLHQRFADYSAGRDRQQKTETG